MTSWLRAQTGSRDHIIAKDSKKKGYVETMGKKKT